MEDILILVDSDDREIGFDEKMKVHIKGQLHRAFSLFIYDKRKKRLLLHRRSFGKYHSGGLWTNSCCSHPRQGENLVDSVIRRTKEELGLDIECYRKELKEVGKFHYYKKFNNCAENEIDHVFILKVDNKPILDVNMDEVSGIQWRNIDEIIEELKKNPYKFTAWFPQAFELFRNNI